MARKLTKISRKKVAPVSPPRDIIADAIAKVPMTVFARALIEDAIRVAAVYDKIGSGDKSGLEVLLKFAYRMNEEVRALTNLHFEAMKQIASRCPSWPVNLEAHKQLSKRIMERMKALGVGTKCEFRKYEGKPNDLTTQANAFVSQFLNWANSVRVENSVRPYCRGIIPLDDKIIALPPLSEKSAQDWFKCLLEYGIDGYDRLAGNPSLTGLGNFKMGKYAGTDLNNPALQGTIQYHEREGIEQRLGDAFFSVTGFYPKKAPG